MAHSLQYIGIYSFLLFVLSSLLTNVYAQELLLKTTKDGAIGACPGGYASCPQDAGFCCEISAECVYNENGNPACCAKLATCTNATLASSSCSNTNDVDCGVFCCVLGTICDLDNKRCLPNTKYWVLDPIAVPSSTVSSISNTADYSSTNYLLSTVSPAISISSNLLISSDAMTLSRTSLSSQTASTPQYYSSDSTDSMAITTISRTTTPSSTSSYTTTFTSAPKNSSGTFPEPTRLKNTILALLVCTSVAYILL
ncbi:hypothetical protein V1511DRAFT_510060 [Dipodascopsis uninucleata]